MSLGAQEVWPGYTNKNISFGANGPKALGSAHQQTIKQGLCLLLIAGRYAAGGESPSSPARRRAAGFLLVELSEMRFHRLFVPWKWGTLLPQPPASRGPHARSHSSRSAPRCLPATQ